MIVDEPLLIEFVAAGAACLDGAVSKHFIAREVEEGNRPWRFVFGEIFRRALLAGFGEFLSGPAAGGTGADYDCVKGICRLGHGQTHLKQFTETDLQPIREVVSRVLFSEGWRRGSGGVWVNTRIT